MVKKIQKFLVWNIFDFPDTFHPFFRQLSKLLLNTFQTTFRQLPDTFQTPSKYLLDTFHTHSSRLPNNFHTTARHLSGTLKTPSRHVPDTCETPTRHPRNNCQTPSSHLSHTLPHYHTHGTLLVEARCGCAGSLFGSPSSCCDREKQSQLLLQPTKVELGLQVWSGVWQ